MISGWCAGESEIDYNAVEMARWKLTTNLHLNNKALRNGELSLPEVVRQQIPFQCQEAVRLWILCLQWMY